MSLSLLPWWKAGLVQSCTADNAYDCDTFRKHEADFDPMVVTPSNSPQKILIPCDATAQNNGNRIERGFGGV